MGACSAAGACFCEEAGIGVCQEDHVAGPVGDAIIRVCRHLIEELRDVFFGLLCGFGLLGADGTEGGKQFIVDLSCIVEERSDYALDPFDAVVIQRWAVVNVRH